MLVCSSGVLVFISGLWFVSVVEVLLHVVESGFLSSVVVFMCVSAVAFCCYFPL